MVPLKFYGFFCLSGRATCSRCIQGLCLVNLETVAVLSHALADMSAPRSLSSFLYTAPPVSARDRSSRRASNAAGLSLAPAVSEVQGGTDLTSAASTALASAGPPSTSGHKRTRQGGRASAMLTPPRLRHSDAPLTHLQLSLPFELPEADAKTDVVAGAVKRAGGNAESQSCIALPGVCVAVPVSSSTSSGSGGRAADVGASAGSGAACSSSSAPARRRTTPTRVRVTSATAPHPPPHWEEQLANISKMRARRNAPVDSMGCERCADPSAEPRVQRYQTLVSLMLSSQTKDQVTHAACKRLLGHGFTPELIAATSAETLEALIYPVGFYRQKAKHIKAATETLLSTFGGDIPDSIEGLKSLPGVGPKMAFIAMSAAWGQTVGIGVDTHVHRICNRLGWVHTSTPEATREALQAWLPREHWSTVNLLLVGFGQQICLPLRPACASCLNKDICPVGQGLRSPSVTPQRAGDTGATPTAGAATSTSAAATKHPSLDW